MEDGADDDPGVDDRFAERISASGIAFYERWRLTHWHTDLKELFRASVKAAQAAAATGEPSDYDKLKEKGIELLARYAELEEQVKLYAPVISLLATEKDTANTDARVADIGTGRRRRAQAIGTC